MENKEFPELEGEEILPEILEMEPVSEEVTPVIEEIPVEPMLPEDPLPPPMEQPLPETEEMLIPEPAAAEETPAPVENLPPQRDGAAFMAAIPDVEEDAKDLLHTPEVHPEITADVQAMDAQGMLEHGVEEPPFDMSILDDPEFATPTQPQVPVEEIHDQEYRDNGKETTQTSQNPSFSDFSTMFQRPPRKGRPRRKKGEGLLGIPNILVTFVWLALILAIGVTAGRMLWVCAADVLAFGREDKPVTITIYESDSMDQIIDKLQSAGLIRYKSLFRLYADISDAQEDIKPGIYDLNTRYDYHALVNFMSPRSSREVVELTIPEGYTCKQIFKLLEEHRICTAVDAANYAANGELDDYWFLEGVERGSEYCLEGYLFPDTYEFYKNSSPREALQKMLNNFNYRVTEFEGQDLRAQLDVLNSNLTGDYTMNDIVIVASLIEKESAHKDESPSIAGVIYNRLFNWDYPALLNIDAAIVYAQGGDAEHIDTSLDSPYNTYLHTGLTPTPIANPGLSSLKAALNPATHNYYYYVLNTATGRHEFSTTLEEHDAWIASIYG